MSPPSFTKFLFAASSLSACRDRQSQSVGYSNNIILDNISKPATCHKHIWNFPCFSTIRRL